MKKLIALALLLAAVGVQAVPPPERWNIQINNPDRHDLDIWRNESLSIQPRFFSYSVPWAISSNASVMLCYSTNNFATAPYATSGVVVATDTGRVSVLWSPACDAGAVTYQYFVGINDTGLLFRASGLIRMHTAPGWLPPRTPLPVWDGWTNNYVYCPWAALLSTSNALAAAIQAGNSALAANIMANLTAAENYADQAAAAASNGSVQVSADANAVLGAALSNALVVAQTNLQAGIYAAAAAGSNYANQVAAAASNGAVAVSAAAVAAVQGNLNSAVAVLSLGDATRTIQTDTQAWVSVAGGTAVLTRVSTPVLGTVRVTATHTNASGIYDGPAVGTTWTNTHYEAGVYTWAASGIYGLFYADLGGVYLFQLNKNGVPILSATWMSDDPQPVFPLTLNDDETGHTHGSATIDFVPVTTNRLPLQTEAGTVLLLVDRPTFSQTTNIVSTFAGISFPVADVGRTNAPVSMVLSNDVLYLFGS